MQAKNAELQAQIAQLTEANLGHMTLIESYWSERRAALEKEKEKLASQGDTAAETGVTFRTSEEIDAEIKKLEADKTGQNFNLDDGQKKLMETLKSENERLIARVKELTSELGDARERRRSSVFDERKSKTPHDVKEADAKEEDEFQNDENDI